MTETSAGSYWIMLGVVRVASLVRSGPVLAVLGMVDGWTDMRCC
jgi:hypothetical protein